MRGTRAKRLRKLAGHGPRQYAVVNGAVVAVGPRREYQRLKKIG